MALWKDAAQKEQLPEEIGNSTGSPPPIDLTRRSKERVESKESLISVGLSTHASKESLISAGLTIEGKIEGAGHVRIAGSFKGDVHVEGNLTIESGAHVSGEVRADNITIAGEVQGNIY